jgi:hypothetical protein
VPDNPRTHAKCVVVQVHVFPVGLNTEPVEVARQLESSLKGAGPFPWMVISLKVKGCNLEAHYQPPLHWWENLLKGLSREE